MKPVPIVLGALVVAASLAAAVLLYSRFGPGDVRSGLVAYRVLSDTAVRVRFEVVQEPGRTALCTVRAREQSGAEVGVALLRVGPSQERRVERTHDLPTRARAVTGEVVGCSPQP